MSVDALLAPFAEFAFMRRALAAGLILALSLAPLGVFLTLRRMSLMGDAVAHGILPGVAVGYLLGAASTLAMALGGFVAGLLVALSAGLIARATVQREDASLASLYLVALALGLVLLSLRATPVDVQHVLFGAALALDEAALLLIAGAACVIFVALALIWPALVLDSVDSAHLAGVTRAGAVAHGVFMGLIVLALVAAFQAVGALMAVGLLVLPAASARFWTARLAPMIAIAVFLGALAVAAGLIASYHLSWPTGPSIILAAGALYAASLALGAEEGFAARLKPQAHYAG